MQNSQPTSQAIKQPVANTPPAAASAKQVAPQQPVAKQQSPISQTSPKQAEKKQFGRKKNGVILIGRQQLYLYIDGMQNVVTMSFTPDVIADLDVINEELLIQKIAALTQQQQLVPASFIVVLANTTLFSKQVTAIDVSQKKVDEEKFLNTIPFETPAVRNIIMGTNTYTVVANQQLFGPLNTAFTGVGSEFSVVLPEFLFGKDLNLAQGLTVSSAEAIMKKAQEFKTYNFIRKEAAQQRVFATDSESEATEGNKLKLQMHGGKSNRMFIVSGMMVMLVGVLVAAFLLIQQNNTPSPPGAVILEAPTPVVPNPTVPVLEGQLASDSASPSTPSAAVQGDTSSDITIQYTQGNAREAYLLTERLRKLGFVSITPQVVLAGNGKSQVACKSSVSSSIENLIVAEVEKQIGATSLQRTNSIQNDIVIFVGNKD